MTYHIEPTYWQFHHSKGKEESMQNAMSNASKSLGLQDYMPDRDYTVGENIDRKIADLQAKIDKLQASKECLKPLLNMKISDLREAMS